MMAVALKKFELKPFDSSALMSPIEIRGEVELLASSFRVTYRVSGDLAEISLHELKSKPMRRDELWKTTCFEIFVSKANSEKYIEYNFSPSGDWGAFCFEGYRKSAGQEGSLHHFAGAGSSSTPLGGGDAPSTRPTFSKPGGVIERLTSREFDSSSPSTAERAQVVDGALPPPRGSQHGPLGQSDAASVVPFVRQAQKSSKEFLLEAEVLLSPLKNFLGEGAGFELGLAAVIEMAGTNSYWALSHLGAKPDFHLRESFGICF